MPLKSNNIISRTFTYERNCCAVFVLGFSFFLNCCQTFEEFWIVVNTILQILSHLHLEQLLLEIKKLAITHFLSKTFTKIAEHPPVDMQISLATYPVNQRLFIIILLSSTPLLTVAVVLPFVNTILLKARFNISKTLLCLNTLVNQNFIQKLWFNK